MKRTEHRVPASRAAARIVLSLARAVVAWAMLGALCAAGAQDTPRAPAPTQDYVLGPGDTIKISVFQNPDLSLTTRVSENGSITYPLIGAVQVGGLSTSGAEKRIAKALKDGAFLINPQVTVVIDQVHGNQVAVLGQFNRPGRYPLETTQTRLSDLIAQAGGIASTGSDVVIFAGRRDGKKVWQQIDIGNMFVNNQLDNDFLLQGGDVLFVDRAPMFYIYGEVQRPGSYRVERNMTLVQALASGGGLTARGTQKGVRIKRRDESGKMIEMPAGLDEPVRPEDVVYVRESIF